MMSKRTFYCVLVFCMTFMPLSATAAPSDLHSRDEQRAEFKDGKKVYDIVKYLTQVKSWTIDCEFDPKTQMALDNYEGVKVTKGKDGFIYKRQYDDKPSHDPTDLKEDEMNKFRFTKKHWEIHANYEYDPDEPGWWVFDPVVKIPRYMKVGSSYQYQGNIVYAGKRYPITITFKLLKADIKTETPGGIFKKCIKVQWVRTYPGGSEESIEIWAPGWGSVQSWWVFKEDGEKDDKEFWQLIDHGKSNPPF